MGTTVICSYITQIAQFYVKCDTHNIKLQVNIIHAQWEIIKDTVCEPILKLGTPRHLRDGQLGPN